MPPHRVQQTGTSGHRRRRSCKQDEAAGETDEDPQRVDETAGDVTAERLGDADERRTLPLAPECARARHGGVRDDADGGDEHGHQNHQPDRREE